MSEWPIMVPTTVSYTLTTDLEWSVYWILCGMSGKRVVQSSSVIERRIPSWTVFLESRSAYLARVHIVGEKTAILGRARILA
jgi:hypothetical protein